MPLDDKLLACSSVVPAVLVNPPAKANASVDTRSPKVKRPVLTTVTAVSNDALELSVTAKGRLAVVRPLAETDSTNSTAPVLVSAFS